MTDWIPFEDGRFGVVEALLVAANSSAVTLEKPYIEIYTGRTGQRWLKGGGLVQNSLMVDLLEDSDELDILLKLGEEFTYLLRAPEIQAGKVFSPEVRSSLKFLPTKPWQELKPKEYHRRRSAITILGSSGMHAP